MSRLQDHRRGGSRAGRAGARAGSVLLAVVWFASLQIQAGSAAGITVNSANLTVYRSCVLSGTSGARTTMFDSYVSQFAPGTNFGTAATVIVQSSSVAGVLNDRGYIKFDLTKCSPVIPATATVSNATVRIWVSGLPAVCRTIDVWAATAAWTEAGVTWTNQPAVAAAKTTSVTVGTGACNFTAAGYVNWTVTADVVKFVAGTMTNNGWRVRDATESSATTRTTTYAASNANSVPQAPQLVVNYNT